MTCVACAAGKIGTATFLAKCLGNVSSPESESWAYRECDCVSMGARAYCKPG